MTKQEIINAAFKTWGRNLYKKTSLSMLAGELGVSKPALYRHFENKQALTAAMTEHFLDDFANSVRDDFQKANSAKDADEGIFIIIESIAGFFAGNVYALIFSIVNIYDRNLDGHSLLESLKSRKVDMGTLQHIINKKYFAETATVQMVYASLTFFMSNFHKMENSMKKNPSEKKINEIILIINNFISCGLGFSAENTALNFKKLEEKVEKTELNSKPEPFFEAVAQAVAEAGPWDVSMEMVAKRLGLSKSSLYGHFKNRKDMLRRLFIGEFKRIIEFARQGIGMSEDPAQQLYLGIFSIAVYLSSRPEILVAMSWIRTRRLDLGKPDKELEIFRLFEDVDIRQLQNSGEENKRRISHWILFLLINILTHPSMSDDSQKEKFSPCNSQKKHIRMLYKFITLGLGGFKR
ncbi:MAG: TetR/AcrR family transcriptional regulator [Treponema sp.]|jgi:AcrR family transcriptional regulator|nr:TetR/AcrR family transcriptional regulator [Treponema sp.]